MKLNSDPQVAQVFSGYPPKVEERCLQLRALIIQVAGELQIETLQECLKWGEPSYISPIGSSIRIGHKPSSPAQYALYFICSTRLVDTFKELYKDTLSTHCNRALVFHIDDELPLQPVKQCIAMALQYHRLKHLPLLGM